MKYCLSFLLTLSLIGGMLGETNSLAKIISDLSAEEKKVRDTATNQLVAEGSRNYEEYLPLIFAAYQSASDPEAKARCLSVLRSLYKIEELSESAGVFGFVLGWYIDHNGKDLKSRPMVTLVAPGTPAEEAGFKPGDVILECDRKAYRSLESRNELMRDLGALPIGTEATFKVMFSGDEKASSTARKEKREVRIMTSAPRKNFTDSSRFTEGEFRKWLKGLVLPGS